MGNCQTTEAATTVVIQHPGDPPHKAERIHWPVSALEVMSSNPGHYVAELAISKGPSTATPHAPRLALLRPSDNLHLGSVYRLIPFEDVMKEFASTKRMSVKLGRLLKDRSKQDMGRVDAESGVDPDPMSSNQSRYGFGGHGCRSGVGRLGQWRPALQSIAEVGN